MTLAPDAEDSENPASPTTAAGPAGWTNPAPRDRYDLVILGAGPAGIAAAELAAELGAAVAIVERHLLGGNSLHAGSVPSKAMIRTADVYGSMRDAEEYGAPMPVEPDIEFRQVMARMRAIRDRVSRYVSPRVLTAQGIDVFFGLGRFVDGQTLEVDGARLAFDKALIATGARPSAPDVPGLADLGFHTSATIFETSTLPRRLAVIGGGPLGCEMAQAFARLGSEVTIIQDDAKFLPREERDAAEILNRAMARDGVIIRLNTSVVGARREGPAKVLETRNNDAPMDIEVDEILLSVGRTPNVEDLGLEAAGVAFDTVEGVEVDETLRSSNPRIYAAGDACLDLKFTNAAQVAARMAVHNALRQAGLRRDDNAIPWCTYCDPEIAHIGLHVWEARRQSIPIKSYTVMMQDVDRAITDGEDTGFLKIHVAAGSDVILGATIVATRASEMINEMAVIMKAGIGMMALADVVHTYPAQSGAIMLAAQAYRRAWWKGARRVAGTKGADFSQVNAI